MNTKSNLIKGFLIFAHMFFCKTFAEAIPLTWNNYSVEINIPQMNSVIFADNKYIAVGNSGVILTTSDRVNWTGVQCIRNSQISIISENNNEWAGIQNIEKKNLYSLTSTGTTLTGGVNFVTVGDSGLILSSVDGLHWTNTRYYSDKTFRSVAWGNGLFLAVGDNGQIAYSNNGTNWTTVKNVFNINFSDLTFGDSQFVLVGQSGLAYVTSNGYEYTTHKIFDNGATGQFKSITWGNGTFVCADLSHLYCSVDCKVWTRTGYFSGYLQSKIFWTGNRFIFTSTKGRALDIYGELLKSGNGMSWQSYRAPASSDFLSFAGNDSVLVAAGFKYSSAIGANSCLPVVSAIDTTLNVVPIFPPTTINFNKSYSALFTPIWFENRLITIADILGMSTTTFSTGDSVNFQHSFNYSSSLADIAYGLENFVTVDSSGNIGISKDSCKSWIFKNSGTSKKLNAITFGDKSFVAIGDSGVLLISNDAENWTQIKTDISENLRDIVWDGQMYTAVGNQGCILSSSDCVHWSKVKSGTTIDLYSIIKSSSRYVICGDSGIFLTSDNIQNWNMVKLSSYNRQIEDICWGNGLYAAVGQGIIITSSDGTHWDIQNYEKSWLFLRKITFGNNRFVITGDYRVVLISDPIPGTGIKKLQIRTNDKRIVSFKGNYLKFNHQRQMTLTVSVFDICGRLVNKFKTKPLQGEFLLPFLPMSIRQGKYIVSIESGKEILTGQIIVTK